MSVFKISSTGIGAISETAVTPVGRDYRLMSISCHFSAAPTTSENFTITLDANAGPAYDTLLYSLDPSAGATTDILWQPDEELLLSGNDAVDVAFANTDNVTWAVQITFKAV